MNVTAYAILKSIVFCGMVTIAVSAMYAIKTTMSMMVRAIIFSTLIFNL